MFVLSVNEMLEGLPHMTMSHLPSESPPVTCFTLAFIYFHFILSTYVVQHIYYIFIILYKVTGGDDCHFKTES